MMSASRIAFIIGLIIIVLSHVYMLQQGSIKADQVQGHAMVNLAAAAMMVPDSGLGRQLMRML